MVKQPPKRVHVTRPKSGGWNVTPEGSNPVSNHRTQQAAEQAARKVLQNGGELITHDRQNHIRESDTLSPAKDPFPPKG